MLGVYEDFPQNVHKKARFATSISSRRLQQTLLQLLQKLNKEEFNLEDVASPSVARCSALFEFGIAENDSFTFLDEEETRRVLAIIKKTPLQIMDFLCAIRYYVKEEEKKTPLKFDYYMLRLAFGEKKVEMRLFHERGPRHISPGELVEFVVSNINKAFSKRMLKPFRHR